MYFAQSKLRFILTCLAIATGIAIVMKTIPFVWCCKVLSLLTALYWSTLDENRGQKHLPVHDPCHAGVWGAGRRQL
jgi:hypothetical protein